jgi:hypothetical protein
MMNADWNRTGLQMARAGLRPRPGTEDLVELDEGKLHELDQLLNDPEVPMQAARVWELLEEISARAPRAE